MLIEVRHGPDQATVLARWAGQTQAFIRDADPLPRTLHRVTAWRSVREGQGPQTPSELMKQVDRVLAAAAAKIPWPRIVSARKPRPKH